MSETDPQPEAVDTGEQAAESPAAGEVRAPRSLRAGWRDIWQVPVLLGGLAVLGVALTHWLTGSGPPDFHAALDAVERAVEREDYDAAIASLNDPIGVNLGHPSADRGVFARYHALSADALYRAQAARGLDLLENHTMIAGHYEEAVNTYLAELTDAQMAHFADTLINMGETPRAVELVEAIGPEGAEQRRVLLRRLVELYRKRDPRSLDYDGVMAALSTIRADPSLPADLRRWTVARQTELRLQRGYPEQALRQLLPEVQRLESTVDPASAELFVLLGLCYLELGNVDEARGHLEHARGMLDESDELAGHAAVALGRIATIDGAPEEAVDEFSEAVRRFPRMQIAKEAWFGIGRAEAALLDVDDSVAAYERVVELLDVLPEHPVTEGETASDLALRYEESMARGRPDAALRYATLEMRLSPDDAPDPAVLLRVAMAHRAVADAVFDGAGLDPMTADASVIASLDPVTLEEARSHYFSAGERFHEHSVEALVPDAQAAGESLWLAADSYDRAGEPALAGEAWRRYTVAAPPSPRKIEAEYRLARAMDSMARFDEAAELYESIIAESPDSIFAQRSYVPLARALLRAGDDAAIERAESLLGRVTDGSLFEPDAPEYSDAKVELAELYRRTGRHELALAALEEVAQRDPKRGETTSMRFTLAETHKLSAAELLDRLSIPQPGRTSGDLATLARARLDAARLLYDDVIDAIDATDPRRRTLFEKQMLRDAVTARADAQFLIAEQLAGADDPAWREAYKDAIVLYDSAAQRYSREAQSLVAMVQIVNCYAALGRWREAQTAQERARTRLASLPESAWSDNTISMGREHWERWLASSIRLDQMAAAEEE